MHNVSFSFIKSQLIYMEIMSNYCICRTNKDSERPCGKISRTSLQINDLQIHDPSP